MVCDLWLVDFDPFCVFLHVFQGSLLVIVIMIDGSKKRNYMYERGLGTLEFAVKTIA